MGRLAAGQPLFSGRLHRDVRDGDEDDDSEGPNDDTCEQWNRRENGEEKAGKQPRER